MITVAPVKELKTRCLNGPVVESVWDEIQPWIVRGLAPARNELTAEDVKALIEHGHMMLFLAYREIELEMVCVTEVMTFPQYKVLHIVLISGKNLSDAAKFKPALEEYALALGCVAIRAWCKEPQWRLYRRLHLGFEKAYNVIELDLRRKLQ